MEDAIDGLARRMARATAGSASSSLVQHAERTSQQLLLPPDTAAVAIGPYCLVWGRNESVMRPPMEIEESPFVLDTRFLLLLDAFGDDPPWLANRLSIHHGTVQVLTVDPRCILAVRTRVSHYFKSASPFSAREMRIGLHHGINHFRVLSHRTVLLDATAIK